MLRISRSLRFLAAAGLLLGGSALLTPLGAQVTIGGISGNNCLPFGCVQLFGYDHYQQVYAGAAFGGPITIQSLTFFNENNGFVTPGTYTFALSTTTKGPTTLSTTFVDNVGSPLAFFATLVAASNTIGGTSFTVSGTPYAFNPSGGNLLLDIQYAKTGANAEGITNYVAGSSTDAGRLVGSGPSGQVTNSNYGLETRFNAQVTTTPEPASLVLLGTGLLGVFGVARRQRIG